MTVSEDRLPSLVVTADDFGISPSVDRGILLSHREGIVGATALMLSFPEVEGSVAQLADAPDLDLGVHLDLTCGRPVSDPGKVPSLEEASGRFYRLGVLAARLAAGRISLDEIRTEWKAQIEMGLRLGCRFTSISSHQHVHMLPGLDTIAAQLALSYEIPFVRLTSFPSSWRRGSSPIKTLALLPFASTARRAFDRQGVAHNDATIELDLKASDPVSALYGSIEGQGSAVCELVCHPGYVDDVLGGRDPYTEPREAELEVLITPGLRGGLTHGGVNLTTFASLALSGRQHDQESTVAG
jgi:predicted glycoside hydrolase/deacetylase ChbG (UPF0249 family)